MSNELRIEVRKLGMYWEWRVIDYSGIVASSDINDQYVYGENSKEWATRRAIDCAEKYRKELDLFPWEEVNS